MKTDRTTRGRLRRMSEFTRDGDFTPEQLKRIRNVRLLIAPLRVVIMLSVLSLAAGGPARFFSGLPGQVFAVLIGFTVFVERFFQTPDFGGRSKDAGSVRVVWIAFGSTYAVAIADWYLIRPHWAILEWNWIWLLAGAVLYAVGQVIRVVSIRRLGRFFTASVRVHQKQRVVREGIYAIVRHPAYTGLLLSTVGIITLFASVLGYAWFVLLAVPAMINRIRVEEKALNEEFGEEYRGYCHKTRRLIPFVY